MANSTASVIIKPTAALNRGDTFIFGSLVCIADSVGSFQRHLTVTPSPKTGLVTLPEVVMGTLAEKFGKISLYNQLTDFESRSTSNSNSMPLGSSHACETTPLHKHFPYGLCNSNRAHAEALAARRAGKEIASEYSSDSDPAGYYSDSSYEFDFGSDPTESKINTTEEPLSGPATGLVITSTPCQKIRLLARLQACRPDG
jgi:hypothetical protein